MIGAATMLLALLAPLPCAAIIIDETLDLNLNADGNVVSAEMGFFRIETGAESFSIGLHHL